jgi:hypothetical protein
MKDRISRRGLFGLLTGHRPAAPEPPVRAHPAPEPDGFDLGAFYRDRTERGAPGEALPEFRVLTELRDQPRGGRR